MPPNRGARRAPSHLSDDARALWRRIESEYELEPHHRHLLSLACESLDLAEQARAAIAEHGLTMVDGNGNPKARPEVNILRDARTSAARLFRELNLDGAPEPDTRPPRQS